MHKLLSTTPHISVALTSIIVYLLCVFIFLFHALDRHVALLGPGWHCSHSLLGLVMSGPGKPSVCIRECFVLCRLVSEVQLVFYPLSRVLPVRVSPLLALCSSDRPWKASLCRVSCISGLTLFSATSSEARRRCVPSTSFTT